jgi:intracellular multiplication protein IcmJ
MRPLELNISLTNYGQFVGRKGNKTFQQLAKQVWERDKYTCQYCGFQADRYQEVINADQNYRNNVLDNLVTACCFCAQCHFIESLGEQGYGGGTLVYFPEMSQSEINALCHVLFFALANQSSFQDTAQSILQAIRLRSGTVDKLLGEGMSEPAVFGQLVLDYTANKRVESVTKLLTHLRVLPTRGRFTKQIEYWAKKAAPPA